MRTFRAFFILEVKRFFSKRNVLVMLIYLLVCLGLIYLGFIQYQDLERGQQDFKDVVKQKTESFQNYMQYAGYGIRLYFMPAPLHPLFYNSGLFSELTGEFDQGEKLNIFYLLKGKNIFAEKPGKLLDFSGFFLLLGSLIALYYGYEVFRSREYLRYLASRFDHHKVFAFIWLLRAILLSLYFSFVTAYGVLFLAVLGIDLSSSGNYLFGFLCAKLFLLIFFFSMGSLFGTLGSRTARFFMVSAWFLSVFLLPVLTNKFIENAARSIIPNSRSELEKLNRLMAYEEWYIREGYKEPIKSTQRYLDYFNEIQEKEQKSADETFRYIIMRQKVSIFFPPTFYLSVNSELGSQGYRGIMDFYRGAQEIKHEFVRFYITKRIEEKKKDPKDVLEVEPFKKEDEYIYPGKSQLPIYYLLGLLSTFVYIVLFTAWSFRSYEKNLFSIAKEKVKGLEDLELELNEKVANVMLSRGEELRDHMYNVLSGRHKEFPGTVIVNNENITANDKKIDFVYLFQPDEMPEDMRVGDFLSFVAGTAGISRQELKDFKSRLDIKDKSKVHFGDLNLETRGEVLLEIFLLAGGKIYMLYDFARGMPADFVKEFIERMEQVKEAGASLLYLTNDILLARKIGDYVIALKQDAGLLNISL